MEQTLALNVADVYTRLFPHFGVKSCKNQTF